MFVSILPNIVHKRAVKNRLFVFEWVQRTNHSYLIVADVCRSKKQTRRTVLCAMNSTIESYTTWEWWKINTTIKFQLQEEKYIKIKIHKHLYHKIFYPGKFRRVKRTFCYSSPVQNREKLAENGIIRCSSF